MARKKDRWQLQRQSDGVSMIGATEPDQLDNILTYKNVFEHVNLVEMRTGKVLQQWGARDYSDLDPEPEPEYVCPSLRH